MRILAITLAFTGMAAAALADAPTTNIPDKTPPPSIWKPLASGAYEHQASGMACPPMLGIYHRRQVEVFDKFGLDVGCDYFGPNAGVTYYLTKRDGASLDGAMIEAKRELLGAATARNPQLVLDKKSRRGNLDWTIEIYSEDNGVSDGIWMADLYGWTLEYRATYRTVDETELMGEIDAFAQTVLSTAGIRLQTCAKAKTADRTGVAIADKSQVESASMMSSILGGALLTMPEKDRVVDSRHLTSCVEGVVDRADIPMVFWRNIADDGSDDMSDRITVIAQDDTVTLNVSAGGLEGFLASSKDKAAKPAQWSATLDDKGQTLIFGYFAGRPTIGQLADLFASILTGKLKPVGGYSSKDKTINILVPPG